MIKIKTILLAFSVLAGTLLCGCKKADSSTGKEGLDICAIEYRYWDQELEQMTDIPEFMWKSDGAYPNEYQEASQESIDDLRNFRKDDSTIYAFEGWYYDVEYKDKLISNEVPSTRRGDITLYAKIVERAKTETDVVIASITYKWKEFSVVKEGINSFPEGMVQGLAFSTEYEEGKSVSLPKLKKWKPNERVTYEFEGWYYDASFENEVLDGLMPTTREGNVTVYAAISIWVG